MTKRVERDAKRYREIVKGKVRRDLKKYITHAELIGRRGKDLVSIPVPQIEIPHFRFGRNGRRAVGQGEGEVGDILGREFGKGGGLGAGDAPGEHILEVELTIEELAQILAEELELPKIQPRGKERLSTEKERYTSISLVGPQSLRHFRRTFKQALKRQLASGIYDFNHPCIIPVHEDMRYRSWKVKTVPESNAAIIYMMDVSGSMGDEQKELVRIEAFWIDTWLRSQYENLESRYIIHDVRAREVDSETFYRTRESGGTKISSAYALALQLVEERYGPDEWNTYLFHFSDGENWSDDNDRCWELVRQLLPKVNLFCYGQVQGAYGGGDFKDLLDRKARRWPHAFYEDGTPRLITSRIADREAIYTSIKEFLGKGK